jgi:hypothetical protein
MRWIPQRSFLDLGFDSLFLTQVSLALQKKYLLKLTLRQMLDDLSSPAAIAHYIAAHRPAPAGPPSAPPPGDAAAEKVSLAQAGPFGPEVTPASAPVIARHGPFCADQQIGGGCSFAPAAAASGRAD